MKIQTILATAALLFAQASAQQVGKSTPEVHPALPSQVCSKGGCKTEQTKVVIDANWRWTHDKNMKNCYSGNTWDTTLCADPEKCAQECYLEGADYQNTYGISTSGDELTLKFVTQHPYGTNVGSRVYLLENDEKYKMFKLLNKEFTYEVDVSNMPCGINGAMYFVEMDADGGKAKYANNKAGAAYGTGYCDAQCPHDVKFINGEANVVNWKPSPTDKNSGTGKYGSCCMEMDIWEANSMSNAYTSHPCSTKGQYRCDGKECGDNAAGQRYDGVCDKDGCDFNPFRMGDKFFYGRGSQFKIDSTKPFTVVTQFITDDGTDNGNLVEIKRLYKQDGKVYENSSANHKGLDPLNSLTDKLCKQTKTLFKDPDDHTELGGLKRMGEALKNGVVLVMSIWDDHEANMLWLNSNYPLGKDATIPGVARGTCPQNSGKPADVEAQYPNSFVKFKNVRTGDIGSTI